MDRVAFYSGLTIMIVALAVWLLRPNQSRGRNKIELFGAKFDFDTPAFAVMVIGLSLMLFSTRFPASPGPIKKVVCTGQIEGNCPGPHDIFYLCGYFGTDKEIAEGICRGLKSGYLRTKTTDGNMCGYSLIEVTCN